MKTTALALVAALALGCGSDPKKPTTPPPTTAKAEKPKADSKQLEHAKNEQVSPNLSINGDIVAVRVNSRRQPDVRLRQGRAHARGSSVLDQLATCMMTGALKGKQVSLIGRADPRGTEEYSLGPARAVRLGLDVSRAPRRGSAAA